MNEKPPALPSELVQEFVTVGHHNLPRVQAILAETPQIVNAAWDWGGGDWETALGGAAHMGRRDIAEYLLAHNARIDLFAAAMLGKLEIVQAVLMAFPDAKDIPGPHGIPLIVHAEKGGEPALAVLRYLQSLG